MSDEKIPKKRGRKPVPKAQRKLPPRWMVFMQEYMIDLNGTKAAIRAGFSEKAARQQACLILNDERAVAILDQMKAAAAERARVTSDQVIRELAKVGFSTMRHYVNIDSEGQANINFSQTPDDAMDAVSAITTETVIESNGTGDDRKEVRVRKTTIRIHDKIKSLVHLGEHTGAFDEGKKATADAFANAFLQILDRGSKLPIRRLPAPDGDA